ncbi:23S rRNA (guanine(745)-N(1))-methyltransferase [Vibrio sp. SCSIO 43137]|uniref:23S rRNA (guanine(745)-N(1))-methyltransferase n=1 Tax=Vibrio sp. SCSIO 43137 TaxID=3021011 RepID=UPI002306EF72|nr:23S rRNA (guanine(745)-N(1))-methyltransferase [Vibrio sp. SCSIO 43137]WCE30654.1 23S rRNA (guanine(745)-N(1))-methyltransferase [Vibrio sp. SCSIO 43137]
MSYQCPLCSQPLNRSDNSFKCPANHQFDVAKEGYVNLIPANKKRSKNPGDNAEMMQARRRFLNSGAYQPLRERVSELCTEQLNKTQGRMLDIGCGEGYYTSQIESDLSLPDSQVYGLDISKVAIRYAAKRYPNCHFSVASSQRLPFAGNSLDLILRIYAPCEHSELARCLDDQGVLITVTPAARHLYQLRELIYQDVRLHSEQPEQIEGFTLTHSEKLSYPMSLSGNEALDLLQMTPFAWKTTEEIKTGLSQSERFSCEADFIISLYKKS